MCVWELCCELRYPCQCSHCHSASQTRYSTCWFLYVLVKLHQQLYLPTSSNANTCTHTWLALQHYQYTSGRSGTQTFTRQSPHRIPHVCTGVESVKSLAICSWRNSFVHKQLQRPRKGLDSNTVLNTSALT